MGIDLVEVMRWLSLIFSLCVYCMNGQQTMAFTQYAFNKGGMNPAANGTEINQKYYFVCGMNRPWTGMDSPPKQNFLNASYTIRQPRSLSFWQCASVYVENEQAGLFGQISAYGGYTVHWLLRRKTVLSAGLYAGIRNFTRSIGFFDASDPAVQRSNTLLLYPDIIPGVRISDQRFFAGISMRQITITALKDFKGNRIGTPSLLYPHVYADFGVKKPLAANMLMMPSVAAHIPLAGPPVVDGTLMFYFYNRVGIGAGLRNLTTVSGIFQLRFLENLTAGFAYSYPLNATRYISGHSYEIMIGIVPTGMDVKATGRHSVAKCPVLEY